jgi:tRNA dimethylallyltransferase
MKPSGIPIVYAPTATGKTEIVMSLSKILNIEICSMDSMQIYKKMDIGTAKPTQNELSEYPHHLLNIVFPDENYDVNRYRKDALNIIDSIEKNGNRPLFVGGTGLYMDALRYGLFEGVSRDENLRKELEKKETESPGVLMEILTRVDPEAASKIHPNDLKRKIRALEVFYLTGKRFSEIGRERKADERFIMIYLIRNREAIYKRVNARVEMMIKKGLIEETAELMRDYSPDLQSMKAIGYRETIDFLNGCFESKEAFVETLKKNTRHYAKRQIIWARRYKEIFPVTVDDKKTKEICDEITTILSTHGKAFNSL